MGEIHLLCPIRRLWVAWVIIAWAVLLPAIPAVAQTAVAPTAGDGLTTQTAYQITSLGNLVWMADQATARATNQKYYQLMNDIDASATATWHDEGTTAGLLQGFRPIGADHSFNGIFLGQGHTISGLTINRPGANAVGLFGYLGFLTEEGTPYPGPRVQDLTLKDCTIVGAINVGTLVGDNIGQVLNCAAEGGSVTGNGSAGGLMGYTDHGSVIGSHAALAVSSNWIAGGLTGGTSAGLFKKCYATGAVSGSEQVGGLTGQGLGGQFMDCYATGSVTGTNKSVGGLCGTLYASGIESEQTAAVVDRCYATGAVTANYDVGGLVGFNKYGKISDCYAIGAVSGINYVGGVIGSNGYLVNHCYAVGAVSHKPDDFVGTRYLYGLAYHDVHVTFSYWNIQTTGQPDNGLSAGTGETTPQMKSQATYEGWDFSAVWAMEGGYPYLPNLPTVTLRYTPGAHGQLGDGLTTGTAGLKQVINQGAAGTPVRAIADAGYVFGRWSDGVTANPRLDAGAAANVSVTALFTPAGTQTAIAPAAGDGLTTQTAYQITSLGNLVWMADQATARATNNRYYQLMNDIDASATASWNDEGSDTSVREGFRPIGADHSFNGIFLGQGHTISGLTINRPSATGVGLFGYLGFLTEEGTPYPGPRVQDLTLKDCTITGSVNVGTLMGDNVGQVLNCAAEGGSVTGSENAAGGLVGFSDHGTMIGSHAALAVSGHIFVGGLVGGTRAGLLKKCSASGPVSGSGQVGGLVGQGLGGQCTDCYATGAVTGINSDVGGLYGAIFPNGNESSQNAAVVTLCYATGTVTAHYDVGGLVGFNNYGKISDCYATGAISGNTVVGGLIGMNTYFVNRCYAVGAVSGSQDGSGGLMGINNTTVTSSYWNIETTGQPDATGIGQTGETTPQMKSQATYEGWDFSAVWAMEGGYPYLRNLSAVTLRYTPGAHGQLGDGLTTGTAELKQVINQGAAGTPVRAIADAGYVFGRWSDGVTANPRLDAGTMANVSVTALFTPAGAPTVSVDAASTSDRTPTWRWTAAAGGNGQYRYQLDATADSGWTVTTATSFTPSTPLTLGQHVLYVEQQNASQQWSAAGSAAVTIFDQSAAHDWAQYE